MPFNTIAFGIFLPIVFVLYWMIPKRAVQLRNSFLLIANCVFYAYWDYRFLSLILVSSGICYLLGLHIAKLEKECYRKLFLIVGVSLNLGILAFFKYFNFFIHSANDLLQGMGLSSDLKTLQLILPLGISFYTFKMITYIVDVYRDEMTPTKNVLAFFAFASFFPTMVAGPIDKAKYLLPQFLNKKYFNDNDARDALRQILNGFFKKMVIADNIAPLTDDIFSNYTQYDGLTLVMGAFLFAIQIYCDFSGYSDIAIGTAKLFGFSVTKNFNYPYFSRDIAEFWRRWHISLSNWLRDYLYVPLCGRKPSRWRKARFIVLTFAICGLWHGANWTFVAWGVLLGIYFIPITVVKTKRYLGTAGEGRAIPTFKEAFAILKTFLMVLISWIFFKSETLRDAFGYIGRIFTHPYISDIDLKPYLPMLIASLSLLAIEWVQRKKDFVLQIGNLPVVLRWTIYYACLFLIVMFTKGENSEFLYFQF